MFGKRENSSTSFGSSPMSMVNMIEKGTTVTGDIESAASLRIDGHLKGNLITKEKLVLGPTGMIEGIISCKDAEISGTIKGTIESAGLLSFTATANVSGDIHYNQFASEPGALVNGTLSHKKTGGAKELAQSLTYNT